jgi:hypothetical protein
MTGEENSYRQTERQLKLRRNKRISIRFPVTVEVPLEEGHIRALLAHTVVVSHAGATLEMDESVPVGIGLQVSPPFGGTMLAEVNGVWVDQSTGKHLVSIRLIDPTSWTSPERFSVSRVAGPEKVSVGLHPGVAQMLAEYTSYLSETSGEETNMSQVAENILEKALLSDAQFQDWFTVKIMEDLQAWEKAYVLND